MSVQMTWKSPRCVVVLAALGIAAAAPGAAQAVGPTQLRDGRSLFDARAAAIVRSGENPAPPARARAGEQLARKLGPLGNVILDPVTGTPRNVARLDGFLTAPSDASPTSIALGYVSAHADVFGLDAQDLAALRVTRRYRDVLGTMHLTWAQTYGGVSTLDNGLRAAVARNGRLVNVQGAPVPDLALKSTMPSLSAADALAAARADGGVRRPTKPAGADSAELTIFTGLNGPRLAWRLRARKSSTQIYDYVIDAKTGAVLRRQNTVDFATGLAWDYFPGPIPFNNSGVATSRDFTAPGWLPATRRRSRATTPTPTSTCSTTTRRRRATRSRRRAAATGTTR